MLRRTQVLRWRPGVADMLCAPMIRRVVGLRDRALDKKSNGSRPNS
jgi:hypothetical protein